MRALVLALAIVVGGVGVAGADVLDRLVAGERGAVEAAVAEVEALPDSNEVADTVFAAGRACEDTLHDPARALRQYDRVLRVAPTSGIAIAARRRAENLRAQIGGSGEFAKPAAELADLIARADAMPATTVEQTARRLAGEPWPGAPDAAMFLAEWLRRGARFDEAAKQYELVIATWPTAPQAATAKRGRAGAALDAKDWNRAIELAEQLPAIDPLDALERDDLIDQAKKGRRKDHLYVIAWCVLSAIAIGFVIALVVAIRRAKRRPRVPVELVYLGPIAAVLVAVSFTAHRAIAPAVLMITGGGLVLTALSGALLELRRSRVRIAVHALACFVAIVALVYIAMMRENLLDMLLETVRFGPDG